MRGNHDKFNAFLVDDLVPMAVGGGIIPTFKGLHWAVSRSLNRWIDTACRYSHSRYTAHQFDLDQGEPFPEFISWLGAMGRGVAL
jgi:hypothetical protein